MADKRMDSLGLAPGMLPPCSTCRRCDRTIMEKAGGTKPLIKNTNPYCAARRAA
jgi:hypothetical protein